MTEDEMNEWIDEVGEAWDERITPENCTIEEAIEATEGLISHLEARVVAMREDLGR